jgi:hypothetical protein
MLTSICGKLTESPATADLPWYYKQLIILLEHS